jgi:hypothetical protein
MGAGPRMGCTSSAVPFFDLLFWANKKVKIIRVPIIGFDLSEKV